MQDEINAAPTTPDLTYGQKAVGIAFNPSEGETHDAVHEAKAACAKLIDTVENTRTPNDSRFANTLKTGAVMALVHAQMMVVKVLTWKD